MALSVYSPERFMKEAFRQAQLAADQGEVPVGAVIVAQNRIIARAHNQVERLNDPTAHAEMLAITAAAEHLGSKFLDECTLYVTLEPCVMCAGALNWSRIGHIFYGADDDKRGYTLAGKILHPRTKVHKGLMAAASRELLESFFRDLREE